MYVACYFSNNDFIVVMVINLNMISYVIIESAAPVSTGSVTTVPNKNSMYKMSIFMRLYSH